MQSKGVDMSRGFIASYFTLFYQIKTKGVNGKKIAKDQNKWRKIDMKAKHERNENKIIIRQPNVIVEVNIVNIKERRKNG